MKTALITDETPGILCATNTVTYGLKKIGNILGLHQLLRHKAILSLCQRYKNNSEQKLFLVWTEAAASYNSDNSPTTNFIL